MNFDGTFFLSRPRPGARTRFAIMLSGSGSNAEKLLADPAVRRAADPVVLVTDAPEKSRAREIGAAFSVPVLTCDLRKFYQRHGLNSISLATPEGRAMRERWTAELRERLQPYRIDFGVLAGFEPLSNITADFPCLNVHPGDLRKLDADGRRRFVGLHTRPIEEALLAGETSLCSSVILARSYTGSGGDMDNGLLLGVSAAMPVEFGSLTLEQLRGIRAARCGRKPAGGWRDELENLARREQERLKLHGDHMIFPLVVRDFAEGRFAERDGQLFYRRGDDDFEPAESLEYDSEGRRC